MHKHDKLSLAFDALALSQMLGREIAVGNIICGDNHARLTVDASALASEVNAVTKKIDTLLSSDSPPELILNRHCPECEFKDQCRQKALEIDELSLLSGITGLNAIAIEAREYSPLSSFPTRSDRAARAKGQRILQCRTTSRCRRLPSERTLVYIHGTPSFPKSETQIYLDIEGLPDNESYYLIGALVVSEGKESFHSFWADDKSEEPARFSEFVESVSQLSDFRILHFGAYDTIAMKRMKARLPEILHTKVDRILERATNVLSVIHQHIYFPVYSNSLKDIGRFSGF